jgi:hypothetical protein
MWIINPFIEHKGTSLPCKELEEHIELSSDKELEMLFKSTSASQLWMKVKTEYPKLHVRAVKFHFCFSTIYLCEAAFSAITSKSKTEKPFAVNRLLTFRCDTTST